MLVLKRITHFHRLLMLVALLTSLLTVSLMPRAVLANTKLPEGLFFIGLTDKGWQFFRVKNASLDVIDEIEHPRSGTYHPMLDKIAYIGSDNVFTEYHLKTAVRSPLSIADTQTRFTQPRYSQDGSLLLAVELPDGRSRRTNIVGIDTKTRSRFQFVRKRTAQFEPQMMSNDVLFYTTAICVDDCEGMIWELWQRDMRNAQQRQLTLMNAVARQPHLGYDSWLYFSSNAGSGHYNIWRMKPLVGSPPEQLTKGSERDSAPATDRSGNLYFLRKDRRATHIMQLSNGELSELELPDIIQDVRHLEVVQ